MSPHDWFDDTFGESPTAALLLDPDGHVGRSNALARELLGIAGDPVGRPLADLLSPASTWLESARARVQADGTRFSVSRAVLEPAARDRRHLVDVELYPRSTPGAAAGVLVMINDRTGAHRDSPESARLFYEAFLHSTNAMELTDRDGYIVDVNPAFERIYGYSREELIGRRPNVVSSGRTDLATYAGMWKLLLDPNVGAWSGELVNRDRRGNEHPVLLAITAIRAPDGSITHFLGVAVDLTERKAWERGAMHSERLASLGQLAAGVAHEINTPLANITLIAESIRRRATDPWTHGRIDSLLHQTESAARIVRGLLDFARRPETKIGEVELGALVTRSVSFLRGKQNADVEVEVRVPKDPVVIRADRDQVGQLITNLVNNAYDAVDGHGRLEVEVSSTDEWARIRVTDNGPGIPPEVRAHLFEPFFTTKPEGKGTGLGLAICHGIVRSHGGTIDVESTPGHGATFEVRLPRLPPVPGPFASSMG